MALGAGVGWLLGRGLFSSWATSAIEKSGPGVIALAREAIEHALTAILLVLVGSTLPALWPALDWRHSVIGFSLLLIIRPLAGWLSLLGTELATKDRWIVGFFGVRGIGSIYYIAYAAGHMEFINESQIWALVAYTVFASAVIHGTTSFFLDRLVSRPFNRGMR